MGECCEDNIHSAVVSKTTTISCGLPQATMGLKKKISIYQHNVACKKTDVNKCHKNKFNIQLNMFCFTNELIKIC